MRGSVGFGCVALALARACLASGLVGVGSREFHVRAPEKRLAGARFAHREVVTEADVEFRSQRVEVEMEAVHCASPR